jgi:hypothetical protein
MSAKNPFVFGDAGQMLAKVTRSHSRIILESLDLRYAQPLSMSLSKDEALRLAHELARCADEISDVGALYDRLHSPRNSSP